MLTKQQIVDHMVEKNLLISNIKTMREKAFGYPVSTMQYESMSIEELRKLQDETIPLYNEAVKQG